jgi:histidinol dehydrogenase
VVKKRVFVAKQRSFGLLSIYDVETARRTILRRELFGEEAHPPALLESLARMFGPGTTPSQAVARILQSVRDEGDAALRHWSEAIDHVVLEDIAVPPERIAAASADLPAELLAAMRLAAGRIRAFHARQPLPNWQTSELGGTLGQRATPVQRVGVYVPGGSAPLFSSLLMSAIPAQVAGVAEIVVCTPPNPHPAILAAAHLIGVEQIFQLGGAQAIAAMAFGTASVPRVDKIVGAGNLFVTLAKQQVYGIVGLDGLAGPTETLVIADGSASPAWVAADLLAQAEHDPLASAILLTSDRRLAEAVQREIAHQLEGLTRAEIIAQSLANRGGIVLTPDLETAAALADEYAAEHLCLAVADPQALAGRIRNAGGLFVGERSFEVLGDYVAGPSHVMPTGGTARFASPLNVLDFVKITSLVALDEATTAAISPAAAELARAEALTAHAAAAEFRVADVTTDHRPPTTDGAFVVRRSSFVSGQSEQAFDPALLARPHIREMDAYEPILPFEVLSRRLGRAPEQIVKLDANENPYGPAPAVREALARLPFPHIYPDPESTALREALSRRLGVPAANLLAGAGADELIDLLMRLFVGPGDAIVNCPPTFGMYAFDAAIEAGTVVNVPRDADFALDVEGIERAVHEQRPKLLFLTSPNNPDGGLLAADALDRLLALSVLVVLDQAYAEFAPPEASWIGEVPRRRNLVVLRTFSKWAGLAGLRVGYGAFPSSVMPLLWKIKQPYNVSVPAATAALVSLDHADDIQVTVDALIAERERLIAALRDLPFLEPRPSQANFLLCKVRGRDAAQLKASLAQAGILVRFFDKPGLRDYIRISVGKPEQTDALLAALKGLR